MTAKEYKKLEKALFYAIEQARASNIEFHEMENTTEPIKKHMLELQAQNHRGYAEGVQHVLTTLNYKHPDMEILSNELDWGEDYDSTRIKYNGFSNAD